MNGIRCALLLGLISAAPAVAQMVGPPVTPAPPAIAPPGPSLPGAESSGPTMAPGITPQGAVATRASAGAPGSQVVRPKATAVVAGKTRSGHPARVVHTRSITKKPVAPHALHKGAPARTAKNTTAPTHAVPRRAPRPSPSRASSEVVRPKV